MVRRGFVVILVFILVGTAYLAPSGARASTSPISSFSPFSVDFDTLEQGWALGTTPCHASTVCLTLVRTTNAGRTWAASQLPQPLLRLADRRVLGTPAVLNGASIAEGTTDLNVSFANAHDGWIYGSLPIPNKENGQTSPTPVVVLWSTHDGGRVWKAQHPSWISPQGSVLDVEATSSTVYIMALNKSSNVTVESSPVGKDTWRVAYSKVLATPAGGGPLEGSIVLSGSHGWLVEGNDRGTTGSAQLSSAGQWKRWTPPCDSVGDSFAVPAASDPNSLVVACVMGGFAYSLSKTAPRAATLGSTWLYTSHNAGRTFVVGTELGRGDVYFGTILASPKPSTIVITRNTSSHQELLASFDGGHRWNVVYDGDVAYVHFISSPEGVALVQATKGPNQLVMTFDGGNHWFPIRF